MIKTILKYKDTALGFALLSLLVLGCDKDFLEDKPNGAYPRQPITTVNDMARALNSTYSAMQSATTFGRNIFVLPDLIADNEFVSDQNSGRFIDFYQHIWLYDDDNVIIPLWSDLYTLIARANFVIDKTDIAPSDLPKSDQNSYHQYLGEAYALRAMAHFALVNFFAASPHTGQNTPGIPYVTELVDPDHPLDFDTPRLSLQETYRHIESDLEQAFQLMNRERGKVYLGPTAVQLLLSRLYLYDRQYAKAMAAADQAISSGIQMVTKAGYVGYWEKESSSVETVFEIEQDDTDTRGSDSYASILHKEGGSGYGQNLAYDDLFQAMAGDVRQKLFKKIPDDESRTDNPPGWYVNKYTSVGGSYTRNLKLLRISEAYLNKIEAEYHTAPTTAAHDLTGFAAERDGVDYSADTGDQLLADILKERRFELCFEGHRLFDLRRNEWDIHRGANASPRDISFPSKRYYLPIPKTQLNAPNNKVTQNPGY